MHPIPIPAHVDPDLPRTVLGAPGDPTNDDVRPCEYIVSPSTLYPGRHSFTAIIALDDEDRAALAAGAHLSFTMEGAEVPWAIGTFVIPDEEPAA